MMSPQLFSLKIFYHCICQLTPISQANDLLTIRLDGVNCFVTLTFIYIVYFSSITLNRKNVYYMFLIILQKITISFKSCWPLSSNKVIFIATYNHDVTVMCVTLYTTLSHTIVSTLLRRTSVSRQYALPAWKIFYFSSSFNVINNYSDDVTSTIVILKLS